MVTGGVPHYLDPDVPIPPVKYESIYVYKVGPFIFIEYLVKWTGSGKPPCAYVYENGDLYIIKVMIKIYLPPPDADKHSIRVVVYICKALCNNITGLCGNYDGIKANDLRTKDGDPVPDNSVGYNQIANSYNIDPG